MNIRFYSVISLLFFSFASSHSFAQKWTAIQPNNALPARANAAAIYNSTDHSIVVFGGSANDGFVNDLWKLDLATYTWSEITTNSSKPFPRHTPNAIYDEANNRMIVYSGQGTEGLANDIWSFDFDDGTWQELSANSDGGEQPSKRYGTVAALDVNTNQLIVFAGFASVGSRQDDTWAFNLNNNSWTDLQPSPHPAQRCLHRSTLVDDQGRMIMYGGQSGGPLEDIWSYDFSAGTWTDLTPNSSPPGRLWSSINYIGDDRLIVFGGNGAGQGSSSGVLNDLWEFSLNDNSWKQLNVDNGPEARDGHCGIFLPCQKQIIVFAGSNASGSLLNDLWVLEDLGLENGATPEISGLQNEYCINSDAVQLTGNPAGGVFSGGASGNGMIMPAQLGAGSHSIRYTVTDDQGCSTATNATVVIVEPISKPDISCGQTDLSLITFNWTHPSATQFTYQITRNLMAPESPVSTGEFSFTQTDLLQGEMVEIMVRPESSNACGTAPSDFIFCSTETCFTTMISDTLFICEGERIIRDGQTYEGGAAGTETMLYSSFDRLLPCDSTETLTIITLEKKESSIDTTIDAGEVFRDLTILADTSWTEVFSATNGCDSTVSISVDVLTTSLQEPIIEAGLVQVYPNPFSRETIFEIRSESIPDFVLEVYHVNGALIRRETFSTHQLVFDREHLTPGMYIYRLKDRSSIIGQGKLIVQ